MSKGYRNLEVNQEVEFEVIVDNNRLKAVNVSAPGGLYLNCERRKLKTNCFSYKKGTSCMYDSKPKFFTSQHITGNSSFNAKEHFTGRCSASKMKKLGSNAKSCTAVSWEEKIRSGVCYSWRRGECHRGEMCRFDHPPELKKAPLFSISKGICYQWQEGTCNKGENCRLAHFPTE